MSEKKQTISVLIPVYHPDKKFKFLLAGLERQTRRPDELILLITADGEDKQSDPSMEEAEKWIRACQIPVKTYTLFKEEFDHGGTRNIGMGAASGQIAVCMTQDAVPADRYLLEKLTEPFERESEVPIIISYARQLPNRDCGEMERYTRAFNYPAESRLKTKKDLETLGIKTFFASNVCAAYKKELFDRLGGFPEHTIFNEDMIFAGKAIDQGYGIWYAANARVFHSHNYSGKQQFQRNFDLAVSQAEHPEVFAGIRSEGEGIRLVKRSIRHFAAREQYQQILDVICMSGYKYAGYLMGKNYRHLPEKLRKKCSLNKRYWRDR